MTCSQPLTMYPTDELTDNGKRKYTFNVFRGYQDLAIQVPCGKCMCCKMDQARANGFRILDECSLFAKNCFVTLTVGDRYINDLFPNGSLTKKPFQDFAKRLRKRFSGFERVPRPNWFDTKKRGAWNEYPIRITWCGEYGSENLRPHFHCILANFDFEDKQYYSESDKGSPLYVSQSLYELWPYGLADIGEVNYQSAFYLSRYVLKKQEQTKLLEKSGKVLPFVVYPSRYSLGRLYYDKYKRDLYGPDAKIYQGIKYKVPRSYDKLYSVDNPIDFDYIKEERLKKALNIDFSVLANKEELYKLAEKRKNRK